MVDSKVQAERLEIYMLKEQVDTLGLALSECKARELGWELKFRDLVVQVDKAAKKKASEIKALQIKPKIDAELKKTKDKNHELKKTIKEKDDALRLMFKNLAEEKKHLGLIIAAQKDSLRHLNEQLKSESQKSILATFSMPKNTVGDSQIKDITWTIRQGIRHHDDGTHTPLFEVTTHDMSVVVKGSINDAGDSWKWFLSDGEKKLDIYLPRELAVFCFTEYKRIFYKEMLGRARLMAGR